MNKRPIAVTIIAWLFIAAGIVGLTYHSTKLFNAESLFQFELALVLVLRLLVIFCGVFILRGSDWARWILVVWIAYHVVLSAFHSPVELATHGVLLAVVTYFLFRPDASAYFRGANEGPTVNEKAR